LLFFVFVGQGGNKKNHTVKDWPAKEKTVPGMSGKLPW